MIRAVAFVAVPAVLAGTAAMVMQRDGISSPAALTSPAAARPGGSPGPVQPTVVGMNLGGAPYYWSGEWPMNDLVQTTAGIRHVSPKGGWPEAETVFPFDRTGHPVHVPKGTDLAVVLLSGPARLPIGNYACTIADGWTVRTWGEWVMKGAGKHFTMVVDQPIAKAGITLMLTATRDDAALSTLSCVRQGADPAMPFNPTFLAETRPYKVLRFMNWMLVNNAPKRIWADRSTPAFLTQGGAQGVSIENMVALANTTGSDPWFNMPLDADPGYYENFATYVRDHLDPKLKAYVEFSNEVWNEALEQGKTATQRGRQSYPDVDATMANDFYYADRVREVMGAWTRVFAGQRHRLVRILADQSVWPARAERALAHKDTWKSVDAVATAPYFGIDPYSLPGTGAARVDALFARGPEIVGKAINDAIAAKAVARKFGLPLVAYEAGPAFVGYQKDIAADMLAVNRDPRIYDLYTAYLKRWQKEVGGLIVLFDAVSTPGPGGQFGHREYTGQPLSEAPKARAVSDFMAQLKP